MAKSKAVGPQGMNPALMRALTPGSLGVNDAACPDTPRWFAGDTPGALGWNDFAAPDIRDRLFLVEDHLTLNSGQGAASTAQSPAVAAGTCSFLNPRLSAGDTVIAPAEAFERLRRDSGPAAVSTPRPIASYKWPHGAASAALEQDITIDGKKISVVRPTDEQAKGKNLPTTAQLAEALRAVPVRQRALTTKVELCPNPHRDSTPKATVAGDAGSGEITLFPVPKAQTQNDFDNRITHESGHNYQGKFWDSTAAVGEWKTAAAADKNVPSDYGRQETMDDFCEFGVLYNAAKGTACEASAQKLYPNRWAKMVEYESR